MHSNIKQAFCIFSVIIVVVVVIVVYKFERCQGNESQTKHKKTKIAFLALLGRQRMTPVDKVSIYDGNPT